MSDDWVCHKSKIAVIYRKWLGNNVYLSSYDSNEIPTVIPMFRGQTTGLLELEDGDHEPEVHAEQNQYINFYA